MPSTWPAFFPLLVACSVELRDVTCVVVVGGMDHRRIRQWTWSALTQALVWRFCAATAILDGTARLAHLWRMLRRIWAVHAKKGGEGASRLPPEIAPDLFTVLRGCGCADRHPTTKRMPSIAWQRRMGIPDGRKALRLLDHPAC